MQVCGGSLPSLRWFLDVQPVCPCMAAAMTQYISLFSRWLHTFRPAAVTTRPVEWLRAAFGVTFGVFISALVGQQLFGSEVALHFLGPLGASAFLLFAVSSGLMSQPWSILGSYLTAALLALLLVRWCGHTLTAACLATGASLLLMCWLRCLHPPGAAVALCVVFAAPGITDMGGRVLLPIMCNAVCLLGCALLYNNLTRVRYPRLSEQQVDVHHTTDLAPDQRVGINSADLERALNDFGEFVDVSREDLQQIIHSTENNALRRSMGAIRAEQIMSCDVQCVSPHTRLDHALLLLTHHHLKALPVLDEQRRLVGIISLIDLAAYVGPQPQMRVEQLMSSPVTCVHPRAHIVELIPLLSVQGLHCLPVLREGQLQGVITQTDLIAALQRDLLQHLA